MIHRYHSFIDENESPDTKSIIAIDDLLVVISPQRGTISFSKAYNTLLKKILKNKGENGYLLIYPGVINYTNRAF